MGESAEVVKETGCVHGRRCVRTSRSCQLAVVATPGQCSMVLTQQHTEATPPRTVSPVKPVAKSVVAKSAHGLSEDTYPHIYSALLQMTVKQLRSRSTKGELKGCITKAEVMLAVLMTCRRRLAATTSGSQAMLASGFIKAANGVILQNSAAVDSEWEAFWLAQ